VQPLINQVHNLLLKNKETVAVAESCTGGGLCNCLTNIPGSSRVFILGIIAYSNNVKTETLKVPSMLIKNKGAVSAQVAKAMALNVLKLAKAHLGIGITGIAGPSGGTKEKPVGTVFIAVTCGKNTIVEKFKFSGTRLQIKKKSADKAMQMLLEFVQKKESVG